MDLVALRCKRTSLRVAHRLWVAPKATTRHSRVAHTRNIKIAHEVDWSGRVDENSVQCTTTIFSCENYAPVGLTLDLERTIPVFA